MPEVDCPGPLVSPEVDLRDFAYMPLDVLRLRDSELTCVENAEVFRAAVLSWCVSWHQIPAGSLPNDDAVLARLLGFGRGVKAWKRIRDAGGLRGWVLCSDGKLYHPVVAEKAMNSWASKLAQRLRTQSARRAREEARQRMSQSLSQTTEMSVTDNVTESKGELRDSKGIGKVKGEGREVKINTNSKNLAAGENPPAARAKANGSSVLVKPPASSATWQAYADAYQRRYSVAPVRNARVNSQLLQVVQRLGESEAPEVARFFVAHNRSLYVGAKHSVALLVRDAEGLRTEWATGRVVTDTESRQIDATQARGDVWRSLIEEAGHGRN